LRRRPARSEAERAKNIRRLYNPALMILKLALLLWFIALCISLVAKGKSRSWMPRLFLGGFVLLLLGFFLKLVSRVI
jgi:hypothetical protein